MNLIPYLVAWAALALIVLVLALYRVNLGSHIDESVHLADTEAPVIAVQQKLTKKISKVEFWGKLLTVVAVLYGLVLVAMYMYHAWQQSSQPGS